MDLNFEYLKYYREDVTRSEIKIYSSLSSQWKETKKKKNDENNK